MSQLYLAYMLDVNHFMNENTFIYYPKHTFILKSSSKNFKDSNIHIFQKEHFAISFPVFPSRYIHKPSQHGQHTLLGPTKLDY